MKIRIVIRNIEVSLYLLFILQLFFGKEISFVISSIYLFWHIIIKRRKIYFPPIKGGGIFLMFIVYGSILGLISYSIRDVFRDYIYLLPSFIWLFIGFYHCRMGEKSFNRLINTLIIYGATVSVKCIFDLACNFTINFDELRFIFNVCIYDVAMIAAIMLYCKMAMKKIFFG